MKRRGPYKAQPGTIGALVVAYRQSPRYLGWGATTREKFGKTLEDFAGKNFATPIDAITRGAIKRALHRITAERGPGAARNWLQVMRGLFAYALDVELIELDPTAGVTPPKLANKDGHATWADHEIAAYRARWPLGTVARLVFEVLLCTGAARADAVRLGAFNIEGQTIRYRRVKVGTLATPVILPEMAEAIRDLPTDRPWLSTERGLPRSEKALTEDMRRWTREAGIAPGRTAHGLRKARGRLLAEAGCSPHEIMAWLGHTSLKEASRYTAAYDRAAATVRAAERLGNISSAEAPRIVPITRGKR